MHLVIEHQNYNDINFWMKGEVLGDLQQIIDFWEREKELRVERMLLKRKVKASLRFVCVLGEKNQQKREQNGCFVNKGCAQYWPTLVGKSVYKYIISFKKQNFITVVATKSSSLTIYNMQLQGTLSSISLTSPYCSLIIT